LLGHGAIGTQVAKALEAGNVLGAELAGVFDPWAPHPRKSVDSIAALLAGCDLVVEAAGHEALCAYGVAVRLSRTDLLVVSVGALADEKLLDDLRHPPASHQSQKLGKLYISTGAIGGLDTLRAASLLGEIESVEMVSTKPAKNLIRPWMDDNLRQALAQGQEAVIAFSGPARQACALFPESANVCATAALAAIGFDRTQATLVGDPNRQTVRHEIKVEAESGRYGFTFENRTSPKNPKTSAIVPFSVVRALRALAESDEVMLL